MLGDEGEFLTISGPYGKMKYVTSETFKTYVSEPEPVPEVEPLNDCDDRGCFDLPEEEPKPQDELYDVDKRDHIYPYYVTKSYNFVKGAKYDQVTLCEIGDKLSYKDAMDKAVAIAKEKNAYGFFYQEHTNGLQIVGLYYSPQDMIGEWVWDRHNRGAIASLDDIREKR